MQTATRKLHFEHKARRKEHDAELHACAAKEFPVGSKVQWPRVYGKPPVKGTVVAIGRDYGLNDVSLRWEVQTKSGVCHSVHVHELEPQQDAAPPTDKARAADGSEVSHKSQEPDSDTPSRPRTFEPPSQEIWP